MKVINLLGGPSSTKSTTAAGVFYELKRRQFSVEYVTEFCKDLIWDENYGAVSNDQTYILGEQNHRLARLRGKVEWVVTDTSLLFSMVYANPTLSYYDALLQLTHELYRTYDNVNYFIERPNTFEVTGRAQNLEQSIAVDRQIKELLLCLDIPFITLPAGAPSIQSIVDSTVFSQNVMTMNHSSEKQ